MRTAIKARTRSMLDSIFFFLILAIEIREEKIEHLQRGHKVSWMTRQRGWGLDTGLPGISKQERS